MSRKVVESPPTQSLARVLGYYPPTTFSSSRYLIYNWVTGMLKCGYVNLLSASPDEELRWTHISKDDMLSIMRRIRFGP